MTRTKLIAATALTLGLLAAATPAEAVWAAPPSIQFRAIDSGSMYTLSSVAAQNNRQQNDRTPIVLSSKTPAVCKVAANSSSVPTYEQTAWVQVTTVGKGTCIIAADQAASSRYSAGHSERSFLIR